MEVFEIEDVQDELAAEFVNFEWIEHTCVLIKIFSRIILGVTFHIVLMAYSLYSSQSNLRILIA